MPHYLKGPAFTLKDMGTAKSGGVIKEHPTPFSKYHANLNTNNKYKDNANTNENKGKRVIKENLASTMTPGIYSNNSQLTSKPYKLRDGKGRKGTYFNNNLTVQQNLTRGYQAYRIS